MSNPPEKLCRDPSEIIYISNKFPFIDKLIIRFYFTFFLKSLFCKEDYNLK